MTAIFIWQLIAKLVRCWTVHTAHRQYHVDSLVHEYNLVQPKYI